jgi:hypothetical protein
MTDDVKMKIPPLIANTGTTCLSNGRGDATTCMAE